MKKRLLYLLYSLLFLLPVVTLAQTPVALGTSPYTENFDGIANGLPNGFGIYVSATASSLGTPVNSTSTPAPIFTPGATTYWNATGGAFKNYASADALSSTAATADQQAATNRALGVRQTGTLGDPGASFVFQVANTTGKRNLKLSFQLQSLDVTSTVTRTTTWVVDYGIGASPTTFTTANATGTLTTGNTVFSNNTITVDFGNALDNQSDVVTIRISALAMTAGGGSRASTAIDDFSLSFTSAASASLTASPTALDFGTTQAVGTTSASKSFALSGSGLTASASVSVTGPYLISKDNATFAATALTYTAAELAATTAPNVYVKFVPTGTTAAGGIGSVNVASGTTTTAVALTGTGAAGAASLTTSATALTFASQGSGTTSTAQTFTLSGLGLSTNTTVSTSLPFSVSKDGVTYSTLLTYSPTELTTVKTIYVQFSPTAAGAASGSISVGSVGVATNKTVTLTGSATAASAAPTTNHVVISQIYGSGGNANAVYNYDFIELYNPTITDIDISNWSLQYQSAATFAAFSGQTVIPANSVIKAHSYYLVQEQPNSQTAVVGALLPNADLVTVGTVNNFNMSGASGKVALVSNSTVLNGGPPSTTNIVDFIGYGAVNYSEGYTLASSTSQATTSTTLGSAATLSATTSLLRLANATATAASMAVGGADANAGNGYDTNVNSADFVLQTGTAIVARGSSSPAAPAIPIILTVTPTALDFGTTQQVTTTSAPKTFTISATNVPSTGVVVSVAAPYAISTTSTGGYTTSLTLTAAQLATAQTIYVTFTPSVLTPVTGSVSITATGAIGQGVILTGTGSVLIIPSLSATPTTLAFGNVNAGSTAVLTYKLSGANLGTTNTTVTATAPYTISKDGATYAATLTYTPTEIAANPTVSVKFTPTAGGAANSTITNVNSLVSASPIVTVTATGVVNIAPTIAAIADQSVCYTTAQQTVAISGIAAGPSSESSQTVILSVKSSNTTLFSQLGVTPIIGGASSLNYIINPGQSGTTVITVTAQDNGGTLNGGTDTFVRTFNITVNPLPSITVTSDAPNGIVEKGNSVNLTATGGTGYTWTYLVSGGSTVSTPTTADIVGSSSSSTINVKPTLIGTYTFTVVSTGGASCSVPQSIKFTVVNAKKLITSNIITPNGDGVNDTWVIQNINLYPLNTVKVFNKAGKIVFSTTGYSNNWNGYYNGVPLPQGTYYYVVDLGGGTPYEGYISVVRD